MGDLSQLLNEDNLADVLSLFDVLHDSFVIFNDKMLITHANKSTYKLLGYSEGELTGKHLDLLIPDRYRKTHEAHVNQFHNLPRTREMQLGKRLLALAKDGEEIPISISLNPVKTKWGTDIVAIMRDMRDWQAIENELVASKKIEAISTFSAGLAHNFNNIITAITGRVYLAKRSRDLQLVDDHLDEINRLSNQATNIVKQIMAYAKDSRADNQLFSFNTIVDDVIKTIQPNLPTEIDLSVDTPVDDTSYQGDQNMLYQVLHNLVINAIHAVDESDEKKISVELKCLDQNTCRYHCDVCPSESIQINVSDTGHGISKENIDLIFLPFFSTKGKKEGTGLGLSMSHGAIKAHGGNLLVDSKEGKGSTFTMCLPNP